MAKIEYSRVPAVGNDSDTFQIDVEDTLGQSNRNSERRQSLCSKLCRMWKIIALVVAVVYFAVSFAVLAFGPCSMRPSDYAPLQESSSEKINKTPFNLILFGDSLVRNTYTGYDLPDRLSHLLPQYDLNVMDFGVGGNKILDMKRRLDDVLNTPCDAVILLWDSDAAYIDEPSMTHDQIRYIRQDYAYNVTYVLSILRQQNADLLLALSGPILMGEGSMSWSVSYQEYQNRQQIMDEYRDLNAGIAGAFGIPYIDLRDMFLSALPVYHIGYDTCLTKDGEHVNEAGATIIAKAIAIQLMQWLPKFYSDPSKLH